MRKLHKTTSVFCILAFLFAHCVFCSQEYRTSLCTPGQGAKKVVSDSPGLVDFAIGLVNSVLNLPDGQAKIFQRIKITKVLQDKCFEFVITSCGPKVALTK